MTPEQERKMQAAIEALGRDRHDEDAWRIVVTATWPIAMATANRILRGALDLAEDATAEAFGRIAQYADFRFLKLVEPADFVKYLKQVVRRCAYGLLKEIYRRSHEVPLDLERSEIEPAQHASTPETIFGANELRDELSKTLNSEERRLFNLMLDGLTTEDIGKSLGISYGSAGVRLHRMRGRIRKLLIQKEIL
jgi:RNA polymerase sigma factor (sigma-70 family)